MKTTFDLNGQWHITGTSPEGRTLTLPGTVPGMVHTDLLAHGDIPDPFWRDNAEQCQWVEHWHWSYEREFTFQKGDAIRHFLELDGLDTYADIYLNGHKLASTDNMFLAYRFDVTELVADGANTLRVDFSPYQEHIAGKDLSKYPAAFNTSDRVLVRRMQCTFAWDWVGRFITFGIWRDTRIVSYGRAELTDIYIYTHSVTDGTATLKAEVETAQYLPGQPAGMAPNDNDREWVAQSADAAGDVPVLRMAILDQEGREVWRREQRVRARTTYAQADIPAAQLWWPVGYGAQPLYTFRAELAGIDGTVYDKKETRFGIRTIKVLQPVDRPGSPEYQKTLDTRKWLEELNCDNEQKNGDIPGVGFTVYVNDTPIFCRGANWVPADPFPARITADKYESLIRTAAQGNINMLRCWGGGIYEHDAFWDACNRHGVLVIEDFMLACARYPDDEPAFVAGMAAEARQIIRRLRNHPCLAWWAGDNENSMTQDFDDPVAWGLAIWEDALLPALVELEKTRPWFYSCPYGGRNNLSLTIGDSHFASLTTDFLNRDFKDYRQASNLVGRFLSESTSFGAPCRESLLRFMTEEDLATNEIFEYHTKDNPHNPDGYPTLFEQCQHMADCFLGEAKNPDDRVRKLEYIHYIITRTVVEGARRNRFYCGGVLFWMYDDCWPASGWSLIDYYGTPKAGYYGVRAASRPVIVSLDEGADTMDAYVCSDLPRAVEGRMCLTAYDFKGNILARVEQPFCVAANRSECVARIAKADLPALDADVLLVCDITGDGFAPARATWYAQLPLSMPIGRANVTMQVCGDTVTLHTDSYAQAVELTGGVFSDNYFDLLPGETRDIIIERRDGGLGLTWLGC